MLNYEEISKIVFGIASKFANDSINGRGWSREKFEEYSQELFLEAYSILKKMPDIDKNYLAASIWNKAGEVFHKNMKIASNEQLQDSFFTAVDSGQDSHNELSKKMYEISSDKFFLEYEEQQTKDLVARVLELIQGRDETIKKFVIAKLKLSGYISIDSFPEVNINIEDYESADITENHKILQDLLNVNGARSGGTNKFKDAKRSLFLDLVSEFDVEDSYRRWFEVEYLDVSGNVKLDRVKKFSEEEVKSHMMTIKNVKEVLSISLEE